jgi:hypothetical protein
VAGAAWLIVIVIASIDFADCIRAHEMQLMTHLVDCGSPCWAGAADKARLVVFVAMANSGI